MPGNISAIRGHPLYFFLVLLALYIGVNLVEKKLMENPQNRRQLNRLTVTSATQAGWLYRSTGAKINVEELPAGARLHVNDKPSVYVGYECSATSLLVLFSIFILAAGGSKKHMLWFILAGCLSIHFINVVRIFLLALLYDIHPEWVDFNHKYVFTILVYSWVFVLFATWINKYSHFKQRFHPGAETIP